MYEIDFLLATQNALYGILLVIAIAGLASIAVIWAIGWPAKRGRPKE